MQTLSQRVDSMIAELGKLRAEVGQLEKLRDVLKAGELLPARYRHEGESV